MIKRDRDDKVQIWKVSEEESGEACHDVFHFLINDVKMQTRKCTLNLAVELQFWNRKFSLLQKYHVRALIKILIAAEFPP